MPEPLRPAATKTYQRENWIFVPTIASAALAPSVAEATGASALDFTNIVFDDGAPEPSQNTNLAEQKRRLGDGGIYQFVGATTYEGGEFTYQFAQQGASASDGVKAWEKFLNAGATVTGFFIRRLGVTQATNVIAGQFVDVYPVEIGPSLSSKTGEGESAEGAAVASYAITSKPAFKVAVLA